MGNRDIDDIIRNLEKNDSAATEIELELLKLVNIHSILYNGYISAGFDVNMALFMSTEMTKYLLLNGRDV